MDDGALQLNEDIGVFDFSVRTWKDDLVLSVEDKQLFVCKQVLGLMSPVFDAMFGGDFKEKNPEVLELPEKKHADFCEFLRCIYPNILQHVTLQNVNQVLPLAEEYQVMRLKSECETCLVENLSKTTSGEELYSLLLKAYLYNLERLKDKAVSLLVEKAQNELDDVSAKVALPPDVEIDIQKRILRILKANSSQTDEKIRTLTALNGCLAASTTESQIKKEYAMGKWAGDSAVFEVNVKGDLKEEFELQVGEIKFTMKITKTYRLHMTLQGVSDNGYDVRVMGMVIVNNWMKEKPDKVVFFTGRMRTSSPHIEREICTSSELENEANGYIYQDGKITGDIHLLVLDE